MQAAWVADTPPHRTPRPPLPPRHAFFSPRSDARAKTHLTNTQSNNNNGATTTNTTTAIDAERLATNKGGNAVNGGWRGHGGGGDRACVAMVARVGCACVCGDQDEGQEPEIKGVTPRSVKVVKEGKRRVDGWWEEADRPRSPTPTPTQSCLVGSSASNST